MFLPISTYRVQLHKEFTLSHLRNILDYLHQLGVHTIYAAPILKAEPGSLHGYDVTDPWMINPDIGTVEDFRAVAAEIKKRGMAWIQDIVPNHMAFTVHNTRVMDVLERGELSPYYHYFDINWNHPDPYLNGRIMVPFLGKDLDECIADGEIRVVRNAEGVTINYFETAYPISLTSLSFLLNGGVGEADSPHGFLANQPGQALSEWHDRKKLLFSTLNEDDIKKLDGAIAVVSQDASSFKTFLDLQWYRLVCWKETDHRINYRRFFTVNSLICLRMEDEAVFDDYHEFIFNLYHEGVIQGFRIDHIDGLNDPLGYLKRLRQRLGNDCYIIAEKILEAKEEMPGHWPLEGTSGYEFLYYANQLFTNRKGTGKLVDFYHALLPGMPAYDEVVLLNKRLILNSHMAGELENIVDYFFELNLQGSFARDRMKEAISLFMLSLPVYRIYPDKLPLKGESLSLMEEAVEKAKSLDTGFSSELDYLISLCRAEEKDISKREIVRFLRRLMQFTGPLTAKGVEDTTFYIYNPLISHVEVGDAPSTLGISIQEFHMGMIRRQQTTPYSLNATATHDTKRGEDARLRLNAISEVPDLWIDKIREWISINEPFKKKVGKQDAPILNDEYFIYQSIVGGFPEDNEVNPEWVSRLKEYMIKVVREAKVMSNWSEPNEPYEEACMAFIDAVTADEKFLASFRSFQEEILSMAGSYSVAQAALKLTAPGIPDIYQGCELFDLSYVDPDNRRPVDYGLRQELLRRMRQISVQEDVHRWLDENAAVGAAKMFTIQKLLELRKRGPGVFSEGNYIPLTLTGHGNLAVGYARHHQGNWCVVVIPLGLAGKNTTNSDEYPDNFISLPANSPREWRNIFTDEPVIIAQNECSLGELLKGFPIAVLCNF